MGFFEDLLFCLPDLFLYAYFFLIKETRLKLISGVTVLPLMQLPRVIGDTVASSVSRKAVCSFLFLLPLSGFGVSVILAS